MIKIREDFKNLIPALTPEEFKQLEANCIADGIREPIMLYWKGEVVDPYEEEKETIDYIIDGHNRYEIAQKHKLEYQVEWLEFDSDDDVKEWMIKNQFGRRNLSNYQRSILALALEDLYRVKIQKDKSEKISHYRKTGEIAQKSAESKPEVRKEIGTLANVSHDTIAKVKVIEAKAAPEVKQKLSTGEVSINQVYQEIKKEEKKAEIEKKREEIKEGLVLHELKPTDKKYRIIYADPPWKYGNAMPEYVTEPQDYYLLMSTEDICNMPVKQITEENAVLFLWSTSPHLPEALEVIKAWGFTYKTTFIWDKIKHNMGHYNSVRHEILMVCTKGACTPDVKKLFDSVQSIERTEHSKKPEEFRTIIETLYVHGNKIELFARQAPNGWDVFGNQIN